MGAVTKAVRELDTAALLQYEKSGEIEVAGHKLGAGDLRVVREFKAPQGSNPDHLSAAGDGACSYLKTLRGDLPFGGCTYNALVPFLASLHPEIPFCCSLHPEVFLANVVAFCSSRSDRPLLS
jgi:hypothetical protein